MSVDPMSPRPTLAVIAALVGCHPSQLAQSCPAPAPAAQPLFVTQLLLQRGDPEAGPEGSEFTLTFSASGDALYAGSSRVPIKGQYMGRIGPERFAGLVTSLTAAGLPSPAEPPRESAPVGVCLPAEMISLSFQTADGRFRRSIFCAGSDAERQLAAPIYRLAEQVRWQPGSLALRLGEP
jgi:hypothetical protein